MELSFGENTNNYKYDKTNLDYSFEKHSSIKSFVEKWNNRGIEDKDDRSFWIDFFQRVLGVANATDRLDFQKKVLVNDKIKKIDVYIPESKVLIEQKSFGIPLYKKMLQSDGVYLTPFEQACRYNDNLPARQSADWIITSNFSEFWIYDMNSAIPEDSVIKINLNEIPGKLNFILNKQTGLNNEAEVISEIHTDNESFKVTQNFYLTFLSPDSKICNESFLTTKIFYLLLKHLKLKNFKANLTLNNKLIMEDLGWNYAPSNFHKVSRKILKELQKIQKINGTNIISDIKESVIFTNIVFSEEFIDLFKAGEVNFSKYFLSFNADDVLGLKNNYAYKLYCNLKIQLEDVPLLPKEIYYSLPDLIEMFDINENDYLKKSDSIIDDDEIKEVKTKTKFNYYGFEKKILNVIIQSINNSKQIQINPNHNGEYYTKVKRGKRIIGYKFKVTVRTP